MALEKKNTYRLPMIAGGTILVLFSSPCIIAMVYDLIVGADNIEGALMVGSFCTMTAIIGALLVGLGLKSPKEATLVINSELERQVLTLASEGEGALTVPQLAMKTELSLAQSERVLDELSRRGYADATVLSGGAMEYVFRDLQENHRLDLESQIERAVATTEQEEPQWDDQS